MIRAELFRPSTHSQAELSGKEQYNVIAATIILELATNANTLELQASGLYIAFPIVESSSTAPNTTIG